MMNSWSHNRHPRRLANKIEKETECENEIRQPCKTRKTQKIIAALGLGTVMLRRKR